MIWLPPCVVTSASVTPVPLTRWSTMSRAWLQLVGGDLAALGLGLERDAGAALEVEPELGLPGAVVALLAVDVDQRDEPVHRDDRREEEDSVRLGRGRLALRVLGAAISRQSQQRARVGMTRATA